MLLNDNQQAFFALLNGGLWEKEVCLSIFKKIDFNEIYRLAEEQSVIGLITAGIEHVVDVKVPQDIVLQFVGMALQQEQDNKAMNQFIERLLGKMREADIYTLLVKGQGIAQCYERPLWRASGDIDLLLNDDNYNRAKLFLMPLANYSEDEDAIRRHLALTIDSWIVELHGKLHGGWSKRVDKLIDEIQCDAISSGGVRVWRNGRTDIFLPSANNDIIIVLAHVLQHFFGGGIGLRQICDWSRLVWTFRYDIDLELLRNRLKKSGLYPKWKSFAAYAVDWLGMPKEAMPLYSSEKKWHKKAEVINELVLETGNFGHGRNTDYKKIRSAFVSYVISFWVFLRYSIKQFSIFPKDAIIGWIKLMSVGFRAALKKYHFR